MELIDKEKVVEEIERIKKEGLMKLFTSIEQSKKLAEILSFESADMKNKVSFWKRIIIKILFPFVFCWFGFCWCIMKLGRIGHKKFNYNNLYRIYKKRRK